MFIVEIDVPPSLNNAYFNVYGRGRAITPEAKAWKTAMAWRIKNAVSASDAVKGQFDVLLELPLEMRGDADNRLKVAIDALVLSGRVPDDVKARETTARKCLAGKTARITVTPARAYALAGGAAP